MFHGLWEVALPLLLYDFIVKLAAMAFGSRMDAAALTTVAALAALLPLGALYRKDQKTRGEEKPAVPWWIYPLMAAAGIGLNYLFSDVMEHFAVTEHFSNAAQEGLLAGGRLVQLVGLGFLVPVTEEVVFRGLLYRRMKKYLPTGAALVMAAAIFALYHGNMVQILYAFPMGFVILLAYEKYPSLAVPVVFHMAANLGTVLPNIL